MIFSSLYNTLKSAPEAIYRFTQGFLGVFCPMLYWESLPMPHVNQGMKHKHLLPKWTKTEKSIGFKSGDEGG